MPKDPVHSKPGDRRCPARVSRVSSAARQGRRQRSIARKWTASPARNVFSYRRSTNPCVIGCPLVFPLPWPREKTNPKAKLQFRWSTNVSRVGWSISGTCSELHRHRHRRTCRCAELWTASGSSTSASGSATQSRRSLPRGQRGNRSNNDRSSAVLPDSLLCSTSYSSMISIWSSPLK